MYNYDSASYSRASHECAYDSHLWCAHHHTVALCGNKTDISNLMRKQTLHRTMTYLPLTPTYLPLNVPGKSTIRVELLKLLKDVDPPHNKQKIQHRLQLTDYFAWNWFPRCARPAGFFSPDWYVTFKLSLDVAHTSERCVCWLSS